MKVVQVLPALDVGGVERGTVDIARALVGAGHESVVISAGGRLVSQLEAEGSRHVSWDLGKKSLLTFLQLWKVRRWLREERPDIVHVRSRMPAWVVWLAWRGMPKDARPRFITTLHGMHSVNGYSAIMAKGERVICVSETCKQYLFDNYTVDDPAKVRVIHRGIDTSEFRPDPADFPAWKTEFFTDFPDLSNKQLICFPGRLTRWKGHNELIDIVSELAKIRDDFHVLVVGGGGKPEYTDELMNRIQALNLKDYFTFVGNRSDMACLYKVCALSLSLTSTTAETFGRAVVESISCGTPCLGYAYGGVKETLAELFPWGAVEVGDRSELIAKIVAVLDNDQAVPPLKPNTVFTLNEMGKKTLSLYQEALSK